MIYEPVSIYFKKIIRTHISWGKLHPWHSKSECQIPVVFKQPYWKFWCFVKGKVLSPDLYHLVTPVLTELFVTEIRGAPFFCSARVFMILLHLWLKFMAILLTLLKATLLKRFLTFILVFSLYCLKWKEIVKLKEHKKE